jgi:tRNA(fMet)-specific endonuclease VapC
LILLDSNTIIHYLKGVSSVVSRLHSTSPRETAIPSIVAYEIEYGRLRNSSEKKRKIVAAMMESFEQAPFDSRAAEAAAQVRLDLEKRGLSIGPHDLLIAGTALSLRAVLITNNVREFSRVRGLEVVDWVR